MPQKLHNLRLPKQKFETHGVVKVGPEACGEGLDQGQIAGCQGEAARNVVPHLAKPWPADHLYPPRRPRAEPIFKMHSPTGNKEVDKTWNMPKKNKYICRTQCPTAKCQNKPRNRKRHKEAGKKRRSRKQQNWGKKKNNFTMMRQ